MSPDSSNGGGGKARRDDAVEDASSWEQPLSELREQQRLIRRPNLQDPGYIRQRANAKLWVRERLTTLLDKDSFAEVGSVTGKPVYDEKTGELKSFTPANCVTGFGRINGRKVFVTADDFSVRGGHADGGIQMKAPYGEILARKARVPLIRLLDGSSGGGSVATYLTIGATYIPGMAGLGKSMDAMSVVPVASALLGPVVGLAAAKAVIGHFSVMVKGLSQLFAAGPRVVKQATFEDLSKEALGGWEIHAQNGTVDNVATSERDAFRQIATFLSYLPSSIFALPPVTTSADPATRREEQLLSIIPRRRARPYDVRRLVRLVVDTNGPVEDPSSSSFFEIGGTWGRCIVTGFARLAGRPVGVLTSDCLVNGGAIDALGSQKSARFVTLCDHFGYGLPLLNLVDLPGFAVGSVAERAATIRHGASAMSALYNATVPIYTVIIRRAFGVAGGVFADPEDGAGTRVAWPSGDWGSLPLEGGIEAAYKRQLDAAGSAEAREKLMADLLEKFESVRSPMKTAHKFGVEEIIDPRDTRPLTCEWVTHVYEHVLPQRLTWRQGRFGLDGKPSTGRGYRL
ncbi:putative carboxyl transferase [Lyophyllum shimeji]|uniref:Propionyl-CoA carboxylase beta chain, mitochondrial n=1 Tax=Lyophyllum shimeji TaxID=47721 RepID=A0A9P3PPI9_LYOSH|nr:putative carboxyl transferase [Lyophyllum shimeji]